jgi:hypothetical protein
VRPAPPTADRENGAPSAKSPRHAAVSSIRLSVASALVALGFTESALGTPPSGTSHFVNYTLTVDPDATDRVRITLPEPLEHEEDAEIGHTTRSPSVFVFQAWTSFPNNDTGWHYHPGIVLATVVEGAVDWYDASCTKHVHKAGDFFMERDKEIHLVRNSNSVPARVIFTFIIAKGLTNKIPVPAPPCAAALAL